jgi:hypothetical protein
MAGRRPRAAAISEKAKTAAAIAVAESQEAAGKSSAAKKKLRGKKKPAKPEPEANSEPEPEPEVEEDDIEVVQGDEGLEDIECVPPRATDITALTRKDEAGKINMASTSLGSLSRLSRRILSSVPAFSRPSALANSLVESPKASTSTSWPRFCLRTIQNMQRHSARLSRPRRRRSGT